MIAIFHAVAQEAGALRFRLRQAGRGGVRLVQTGIGGAAAAAAAERFFREAHPAAAFSAGFAGGLDPALRVGDLVHDPSLSTLHLPEDLPCRTGRIVSVERPIETPGEKAALWRAADALAVDMESKALAAACQRAEVPLLVLRAISDCAADALPLPFEASWDAAAQRPRPGATVRWLLAHPGRIPALLRFMAGMRAASHRLADGIEKCLDGETMRRLAAAPARRA
jgi:adenosylhomocysteine nucleosidase